MPANRLLSPHEAVEVTAKYLADGELLHASPIPNLSVLKAQVPRRGGVDNDTHEVRVESEPVLYLHDEPRMAFMIGAIANARNDGLAPCYAVDGKRDEHGNLTGEYDYFATERGKQEMARESKYNRLWDDIKKTLTLYVVHVDNPNGYYDSRRREWVVRSDVRDLDESSRVAGRYLVDALTVTTDFFDELNPVAFNDLLATDDPRVPAENRARFARYYTMLGLQAVPQPLPALA